LNLVIKKNQYEENLPILSYYQNYWDNTPSGNKIFLQAGRKFSSKILLINSIFSK
jgi:hypothetical protein